MPLSTRLAAEQRGDRRGARALDDELRALEQQRDRLGDLLVLDVHDVVEEVVAGSTSSARPDA